MARLSILLDANIIMDVFTRRQPFLTASSGVWAAVESGRVQGILAAHTVTTLFYLVERYTSAQQATQAVSDLLRVFDIAPIDQTILLQALALGWRDFEDAVQACAAAQAGADYIVTRDSSGYSGSPLPSLSPENFLGMIHTR
jgi:predicted nucleic acid-binding protein